MWRSDRGSPDLLTLGRLNLFFIVLFSDLLPVCRQNGTTRGLIGLHHGATSVLEYRNENVRFDRKCKISVLQRTSSAFA